MQCVYVSCTSDATSKELPGMGTLRTEIENLTRYAIKVMIIHYNNYSYMKLVK